VGREKTRKEKKNHATITPIEQQQTDPILIQTRNSKE
jgi:hypothetical protein